MIIVSLGAFWSFTPSAIRATNSYTSRFSRKDASRSLDALPLLAEDFEAHWPNTRERIRSREDFIALNEHYPGSWRYRVRRIEEHAGGAVTVTEISNGKTGFFAVSFFTVRDGRITVAEEYFGEKTVHRRTTAPPGRNATEPAPDGRSPG